MDDATFRGKRVLAIKTADGLSKNTNLTYTCAEWRDLSCDSSTASACGVSNAALLAVRKACPLTCGLCDENEENTTPRLAAHLGGDPVFHYGDKWYKIMLPPQKPVPLLSWSDGNGKPFFLFGQTFGTTDPASISQWFGHFTIVADGKKLFNSAVCHPLRNDCTTAGLKTMRIDLDGKPMEKWKDKQAGVQVSVHEKKQGDVGNEHAERITLLVGGAHLEIFSAAGAKFASVGKQVKYSHLNLKLVKIPLGARGLLAELSGQRVLSQESMAFVVPAIHPEGRQHAAPALQAIWDAKAQSLSAQAANQKDSLGGCPAVVPNLGKTNEGCKLCVHMFGTDRTFWFDSDDRCADGCCPNRYPCDGARARGEHCESTVYNHTQECDNLIFPEVADKLNKTLEGCKQCVNAFGGRRTFYLNGDSRCPHGCCVNKYPCSGARTAGGTCDGTAFEHEEECEHLDFSSIAPKSPAGTSSRVEHADVKWGGKKLEPVPLGQRLTASGKPWCTGMQGGCAYNKNLPKFLRQQFPMAATTDINTAAVNPVFLPNTTNVYLLCADSHQHWPKPDLTGWTALTNPDDDEASGAYLWTDPPGQRYIRIYHKKLSPGDHRLSNMGALYLFSRVAPPPRALQAAN